MFPKAPSHCLSHYGLGTAYMHIMISKRVVSNLLLASVIHNRYVMPTTDRIISYLEIVSFYSHFTNPVALLLLPTFRTSFCVCQSQKKDEAFTVKR